MTKEFQCETRDVAVIGPAPSIHEDLKKIPKDCILIGVNHHWIKLGIECKYCCFLDDPKILPGLQPILETNTIKVTKRDCSDVELPHYYIDEGDSGMFAVWWAAYITSGNVYVCGMNLKLPGKMYFHGDRIVAPAGRSTDRKEKKIRLKLSRWNLVWPKLYRQERVIPVSGPLIDLKEKCYTNTQIVDFPKTAENILVCGGGPTLEDDLKKIRGRVTIMAVNYHAFRYCNPKIMVFMDEFCNSNPEQQARLKENHFTKISLRNNEYTHYFTWNQSPNWFRLSGHLALWAANYIGTGRIFMAGFTGKQKTDHIEQMSWGGPSDDQKRKDWEEVLNLVERDRVEWLSGPYG